MSDRYIVRTQDDYFNVTDTSNNVPIVNGIRTKIEAEWLCNTLNELEGENKVLKKGNRYFYDEHKRVVDEYQNKIKKLENENQELKEFITSMGFTIKKENGTIIRLTKENGENE